MPRKTPKAKEIKEIYKFLGWPDSAADTMARLVGKDEQSEHDALLKRMETARGQGIKFSRADMQEFLGEDKIPPKFQKYLADEES